jgi:PilZ domain-containing protein
VSVLPRRISNIVPKVDDPLGERSSERVAINANVTFLHPPGLSGMVIDASDTGMRVVVDQPLHPGDRCIVLVHLAGGDTHERAKVVWLKRQREGWVCGLEFVA